MKSRVRLLGERAAREQGETKLESLFLGCCPCPTHIPREPSSFLCMPGSQRQCPLAGGPSSGCRVRFAPARSWVKAADDGESLYPVIGGQGSKTSGPPPSQTRANPEGFVTCRASQRSPVTRSSSVLRGQPTLAWPLPFPHASSPESKS